MPRPQITRRRFVQSAGAVAGALWTAGATAAIRWVTEHGYKPVFFHEGFLGGRE